MTDTRTIKFAFVDIALIKGDTGELSANEYLQAMQRQQSVAIRMVYSQCVKQMKEQGGDTVRIDEKPIRTYLNSFDNQFILLDSWWLQSAVKIGIGMFKSDLERMGQDFKPRVFGGKGQFIRKAKGLISHDEWQQSRLHNLVTIGESLRQGNRKATFQADSILISPKKGLTYQIQLPKLRKNYQSYYDTLVKLTNNKQTPCQVAIDLTNGEIALSFDMGIIREYRQVKNNKGFVLPRPPKKGLYAGIDLNPNNIGVGVIDGNTDKIVANKLYDLSSLTGKHHDEGKLEYECIEVAHDIGRWLTQMGVEYLFLEKLDFAQGNKGIGKAFNRLCINQWKINRIKDILGKYYRVFDIGSAYSSTIGNILYPQYPDPIASSIEIGKRGYRIIILKTKQFYPSLPSQRHLNERWKQTEIPDISDWKDLHGWLKNSKLRYRVSLEQCKGVLSSQFNSRKSQVKVVTVRPTA